MPPLLLRALVSGYFLLLVNAAYLVAVPSPSLWYFTNVAVHPALGLTLALAVAPRLLRRRWVPAPLCMAGLATLGLGLLLGVVVAVVGATRANVPVLYSHIGLSVIGSGLLAVHLWRAVEGSLRVIWGVRAAVVVVLVGGLAAPVVRARGEAAWREAHRITNPGMPPTSMEGEGAGPDSPFFPSSGRHQCPRRDSRRLLPDQRVLRTVPHRHLRAVELLRPPLLVVQQPVVSQVDRVHAGCCRHPAIEVVRRLPRPRRVLQRQVRSPDQGADRYARGTGGTRVYLVPFDRETCAARWVRATSTSSTRRCTTSRPATTRYCRPLTTCFCISRPVHTGLRF